MSVFRLTVKALEDLKFIGRYTETIWGRVQRNKYLSMLDQSFHTIAKQPGIGIACDDIRPGYRKYHAGRHLIFYRPSPKRIDIIRISHDRMDIDAHF